MFYDQNLKEYRKTSILSRDIVYSPGKYGFSLELDDLREFYVPGLEFSQEENDGITPSQQVQNALHSTLNQISELQEAQRFLQPLKNFLSSAQCKYMRASRVPYSTTGTEERLEIDLPE